MLDTIYRKVLLPPVARFTSDDAEQAHDWFLKAMTIVEKSSFLQQILRSGFRPDPLLKQTLLDGVEFPSPFGIAAGFDKNAKILRATNSLCSPGFIEIGTATLRPQIGNPRPRIARIGVKGLINAMGFPNEGVETIVGRMMLADKVDTPLGLNIGKLKDTTEQDTAAEYGELVKATTQLRKVTGLPKFYVVNVSSPNTPGLRAFQKIEPLQAIVEAVVEQLDALSSDELNLRHRLLIKLSADIDLQDIDPIVEMLLRFDLGGLVTTNTTISRPVVSKYNERAGGYSGEALYDISAAVTKHTAKLLPKDKTLIACGGIDSVERAYEMLHYADLIGCYTGIVLKGMHLLREMNTGVARLMRKDGVKSLAELRSGNRA